jgi:hypothetical protein
VVAESGEWWRLGGVWRVYKPAAGPAPLARHPGPSTRLTPTRQRLMVYLGVVDFFGL